MAHVLFLDAERTDTLHRTLYVPHLHEEALLREVWNVSNVSCISMRKSPSRKCQKQKLEQPSTEMRVWANQIRHLPTIMCPAKTFL